MRDPDAQRTDAAALPPRDPAVALSQTQRRGSRPDDPVIPVEIVARAQRGDQEAFATLFRLRGEAVIRYVSRLLRSDRAEDAAAETFLRAWENLPRLREPDRFDAWLFRIAHHVATDELRGRATAPLVDAAETADTRHAADPEIVAAVRGDTVRLRQALLELPERQREVLVLRYFADRSDAEVAEQLNTTEGNVRVLRSRATKRIRELLSESQAS